MEKMIPPPPTPTAVALAGLEARIAKMDDRLASHEARLWKLLFGLAMAQHIPVQELLRLIAP